MFESVLFFIVAAVLSYGIYIRGRAKRAAATIRIGDSIDYTLTIWAERALRGDSMGSDQLAVQPQRISVDYAVSLVFAEEEEMSKARTACAQRASEDFNRRFVPMLGAVKIGAIRFDLAHRDG